METVHQTRAVDLSFRGGAAFQTTETEKIERAERQSNLTMGNLREEYGRDFVMH